MTGEQEWPPAHPCIGLISGLNAIADFSLLNRLETLQLLLRQMLETANELQETPNIRDQGSRLKELFWYQRQLAQALEGLQDSHFKKDPEQGLKRALRRHLDV